MTNITLQKQHRTLWHFIPGLALSAVITGVALWGGSIPAVAGAGFSALTLAILLGMVLGNTIYPHIWKSCDGGVLGKNLRRCVVIFFTGGFEFIDGLRRERCGTPLTLVFGEQGKRGCVDFGGANCGICQTASSTNVRSNVFHARTPVKPAGGKR